MADAQQYGPSVPAGTTTTTQTEVAAVTIVAAGLIKEEPASHSPQQQAAVSEQAQSSAVAAAAAAVPVQTGEPVIAAGTNTSGGAMSGVAVLAGEVNHGDEVVKAAAEFERQSRKMKGQITVKAEAEPGPTDGQPEMGKSVGVTARTYIKAEDKDHADWTDAQAEKLKNQKESKSKKRKRDETEKNIAKQQLEEINKKKAEQSGDSNPKPKKKAKKANNQNADSTQLQTASTGTQVHPPASTQTPSHPTVQQLTPQQQQQLQQQQQQQQQVVQTSGGDQLQFMHLTDDIRDSLDLLSPDQKTSEYYAGEFQSTEFNESKPLADLLLNQNMVSYNQDGTLLSQGGTVLGTSQMIAQAYNQAQQLSTSSVNQQQLLASGLAGQMAGQMGITIIPAPAQDGGQAAAAMQDGGQATMVTDDSQGGGTLQQTINGTTYTSNMVGSSQVSGSQSISAFPLGQNVIIASPGTPQQAGNFMFTSAGQMASGLGQNIVIAAPGQPGGYIVKQETQEELAQTLVLASQNPQQTLGPNVIMGTSTPHTVTLSDGTSMIFTHPSEGHHGGKAITITSKSLSGAIPAPGATIQTQGGMQPMSLVLPHGSFLPQLQNMSSATAITHAAPAPAPAPVSPVLLQLSAKVDKMLVMMQEVLRSVGEANKRLDRLEAQLAQNTPKSKKKSSSNSTATTTTTTSASSSSSSSANPGQSKSDLKAALADYLTITGFNNKDELKRNESGSDLFIPVGTVSLPVAEAPSPGGGETATSTVSELPDRNLLVLNNAAPVAGRSEVTVPAAPDSQSGIAVTIYDSEGGTYELGPDSSKDNAGARFTTVSQNPKTVIVDPKFWDMLVEDFQKNMTSKQIMTALANIRKPLVRNMGNNEISICSSVLKEAEEACQGRRERLAKELVFRIFTLGEVYDRNVSGVFYIKGKKMENKHKALDPAKMSAIRFLVMRYPPSVLDNPRLEKLVWKNCVDRINDALRRIYNWIHKLVDINSIIDKLPTQGQPNMRSP